jgi:hypothetical protein
LDENTVLEVEPIIISIAVVNSFYMALLIMTKLYNGLWVFQANLSSYKDITQKENYNSSEIAPKDKKKKKKKKKDEEQDNPADVQNNNVLT